MLEIGLLIDGKYRILSEVGHGGMSTVYLAMNEKANKQWAIKEIRKNGTMDHKEVEQDLIAESEMLKKLHNPYLPSIIDIIEDTDKYLIVMDYIEGLSLQKILNEYGVQPQEEVIKWALQLCNVLGYLHSRRPPIIYRDLKPANIMLKPDGNITLIDFGTAREYKEYNAADTTYLGTVGYAAPEQFGGMGQTDARTDIYCLGATLYHLVTGKSPCEEPYEIKPIREINPQLSSGFEKIILKCTEKDPANRYQSAEELKYALENYEFWDKKYRRKQIKRLTIFTGTVFMAGVMAGVSAWGYKSAEYKKNENYDGLLIQAKESGNVESYYEAIVTDPTRIEAYEALGEFLVSDGELSQEEGGKLTQLRIGIENENKKGFSDKVDALEELKKADMEAYQDVCYEYGQLFLYNYATTSQNDLYERASVWFKEAQSEGRPLAKLYCDIADCMNSINKYKGAKITQNEKKYAEYKALWSKLKELKAESQNITDTDSRIQVWIEVNDIINDNLEDFLNIMESSEIKVVLDELMVNADSVTDKTQQDTIKQLKEDISNTTSRLSSYKGNNQTTGDIS